MAGEAGQESSGSSPGNSNYGRREGDKKVSSPIGLRARHSVAKTNFRSQQHQQKERDEIVAQRDTALIEANTDSLTGVLNEGGFQKRLNFLVQRAIELNKPFALIYFDANGLREANNTKGHAAGNKLLIDIANALDSSTRAEDAVGLITEEEKRKEDPLNKNVARWGGDEYAVLLSGTNRDGVMGWWKRTEGLLASKGISIGGGVAIFDPKEFIGISNEEKELKLAALKNRADAALYLAKPMSKDPTIEKQRVLIFGEDIPQIIENISK